MIDFTSALYLGMKHPSSALRPWSRLTTGLPAALGSPAPTAQVEVALASLQGTERAVLAPSTLHLAWDLFGLFSAGGVAIHVDAGAYPVARWGVERAAARGVAVGTFPHHDARALRRRLEQSARGIRPVVLCDGLCPSCGRLAPLGEYLAAVRAHGGKLVVDDTQALGILGMSSSPEIPYGRGGGGSLRHHGAGGADVVVLASLAKGFGVPIAALAGGEGVLRAFVHTSDTRVHCSAPSTATVLAAEHALAENQSRGDALRARLAGNVRHFREQLRRAGLCAVGGLLPVQTIAASSAAATRELHERLERGGIRTLLLAAGCRGEPRAAFIVRSDHLPGELDRAAAEVERGLLAGSSRRAAARDHSF